MPKALPFHTCPTCSSHAVERVRRRHAKDHIKSLFGWRVYRCLDCGARFYDHPTERQAV